MIILYETREEYRLSGTSGENFLLLFKYNGETTLPLRKKLGVYDQIRRRFDFKKSKWV